MKKQLAICATLGCATLGLLGFAATGPVAAQAVYVGPGYPVSEPALPPYEVMSIVRSTGLAPLTRPMRRGPYYVLVAVDRVGRQMRVVVDAQLGDIVNMRPAAAAASYGPEFGPPNGLSGTAALPPGPVGPTAAYGARSGADTLAPTPPRAIPNPAVPRAAGPNGGNPGGTNTSGANPNATPNINTHAASSAPAASPSTRVAVAEPALPPPPPLPRPRPKLALNEAPAAVTPAPDPEAPAPAVRPAPPAVAPPSAAPTADDAAKIE